MTTSVVVAGLRRAADVLGSLPVLPVVSVDVYSSAFIGMQTTAGTWRERRAAVEALASAFGLDAPTDVPVAGKTHYRASSAGVRIFAASGPRTGMPGLGADPATLRHAAEVLASLPELPVSLVDVVEPGRISVQVWEAAPRSQRRAAVDMLAAAFGLDAAVEERLSSGRVEYGTPYGAVKVYTIGDQTTGDADTADDDVTAESPIPFEVVEPAAAVETVRYLTPDQVPDTHQVSLSELFARMDALDLRLVGSSPAVDFLEAIALHEAVAAYLLRHRALRVREALDAGATWSQVAAARGVGEADARGELAAWARDQLELRRWTEAEGRHPLGLDEDAFRAVMVLAQRGDTPGVSPDGQTWTHNGLAHDLAGSWRSTRPGASTWHWTWTGSHSRDGMPLVTPHGTQDEDLYGSEWELTRVIVSEGPLRHTTQHMGNASRYGSFLVGVEPEHGADDSDGGAS